MSTSSAKSSAETPHLSLPPYCSGKGHATLSLSPCTLLNPCALASTGAALADFDVLPDASGVAERGVDGGGGGADVGVGVDALARAERPLLLRVAGRGCLGVGVDTAVDALNDRGLRAMPW